MKLRNERLIIMFVPIIILIILLCKLTLSKNIITQKKIKLKNLSKSSGIINKKIQDIDIESNLLINTYLTNGSEKFKKEARIINELHNNLYANIFIAIKSTESFYDIRNITPSFDNLLKKSWYINTNDMNKLYVNNINILNKKEAKIYSKPIILNGEKIGVLAILIIEV